MTNNHIFALDIGTRSVTGIILEKDGEKFSVIDYYVKEHEERSMLDGQIHNVLAVSEVIKIVKEALEERNGPLHEVSVAAAGRALKTVQAIATINLNEQPITDNEAIKHLELSAVQTAQLKLAKEEDNDDYINYYCVGYSILHYRLDKEEIGSLIDQNGHEASVEIIATFLPKVVVESLIAALNRADLDMKALTLEPIAAIHVLIPESMRRLNVALVDIGAGTSDIAITNQGTIVAYGMVPIAGDEITEALSDHYILDFPVAEETKRNIVLNGEAIVQDILGFETTVTYETLVTDIADKLNELSSALAAEIMRLNNKAPQAVMLVGGGSLTPEITTVLANKLQLPANRVAVRGIEAIQNLTQDAKLPPGPDFVTPIGIAIAAQQNPVHYISVKVNDQSIRMFEMKELTIGDCLVQTGIEINKLYGKPGLAIIVTVQGKEITLPGGYGEAPTVYLNNELATVDSFIRNKDEITIENGASGNSPSVSIKELLGEIPSFDIYFNDKEYKVTPRFDVNNELKDTEYIMKDKDILVLKQQRTIEDFLQSVHMEHILETMKPYKVYVNNQEVHLKKTQTQVFLNNEIGKLHQPLKQADKLNIITTKEPTVKVILEQLGQNETYTIEVSFNDKQIQMSQEHVTVHREGVKLLMTDPIKSNDYLDVKEEKLKPFIFQDVFRYVDIDLSNVNGIFTLYKNDIETTFYEPVVQGDKLAIKWR